MTSFLENLKPHNWLLTSIEMLRQLKGALNPNFLNFTKNREKFCL